MPEGLGLASQFTLSMAAPLDRWKLPTGSMTRPSGRTVARYRAHSLVRPGSSRALGPLAI